jgi:hypothetical protein
MANEHFSVKFLWIFHHSPATIKASTYLPGWFHILIRVHERAILSLPLSINNPPGKIHEPGSTPGSFRDQRQHETAPGVHIKRPAIKQNGHG